MEPRILHITEADLVRDVRDILRRVVSGTQIVIERDAHPIAVLHAPAPLSRSISDCIALAAAHEVVDSVPTQDPDFAADVEEIVRKRQPWTPAAWD